MMRNFYPGPSKVYPEVRGYLQDAFDRGILSIGHRGSEFTAIVEKTVGLMKTKLNIPQDYSIYFTSSATECWEIVAQSLTAKTSFHAFNGAFGKKWMEYTAKLSKETHVHSFGVNEILKPEHLEFAAKSEIICITQNETSNGTQVSKAMIAEIKAKYPHQLIAVDATSSLGGVDIGFEYADIVLGSVQKCFGLPAGLGLLICSPKALARARALNEKGHYNSLLFIDENMKTWQTNMTPNVLNIYLLMRVMEQVESIDKLEKKIKERANDLFNFFENLDGMKPLIESKDNRSDTIIAVSMEESLIKVLKAKAKESKILLGNGYGDWKANTFRIANFPAVSSEDLEELKSFFQSYKL